MPSQFQLVYDFQGGEGNFGLLSTDSADELSERQKTFRDLGFELPSQM